MKSRVKERKNAIISFVITVSILVFVFMTGNMIWGENTIIYSDLGEQYIPIIKSFWRAVFSEESLEYSFSMGLGMPSVPTYSCIALSPLNIFYFLFDDYALASVFVVTIKLGMSAYFFSMLMKREFSQEGIETIIFSCCYALCGHAINFFCNIHFLDGLYILPIVVELVIEEMKTGRWIKLTVAYAYIFIVHFYEGFIIGIFSFLLFLLLVIFSPKSEKKNRNTLQYFICVVNAILISAIVTIPTGYYYLTHNRDEFVAFEKDKLTVVGFVMNLFMGKPVDVYDKAPALYSSIFCCFMIPQFYFASYIAKKEKITCSILLTFLVLGCFVSPIYYFLHAFNSPDGFDYRFSYLISFVLCFMGCRGLKKGINIKSITNLFIAFALSIILICVYRTSKEDISKYVLFINLSMLILYLCCAYIRKSALQRLLIFLLVMVELCANGIACTRNLHTMSQSDLEFREKLSEVVEKYDETQYRLTTNYFINAPILYGYKGVSFFSSFENKLVRDTMKRIGFCESDRSLYESGSTQTTRALLGIRYSIDSIELQSKGIECSELCVREENVLPLAYMVNDNVVNYKMTSYNAPQNINELVTSMCGDTIIPLRMYDDEINVYSENVRERRVYIEERVMINGSVHLQPGEYVFLERTNNDAAAFYMYLLHRNDNDNDKMYAFFELDESFGVEGSPLALCEDGEKHYDYPYVHISKMIPLSDGNNPMVGVFFNNPQYGIAAYRNVFFVYENKDEIEKMLKILSPGTAQNLTRKGDRISFDIMCEEGKSILFTSIPYDEGWHILVDGNETEILKLVNETFLGAVIPVGEHKIVLYYNSIENKIGLWTSIVGLILFIILLWNDKKKLMKD